MHKNRAYQKIIAMVLSIIMAVCMTPAAAADDTMEVSYIDENGVLRTVTATVIQGTTTALTNEWYVAVGILTLTNLSISGDVRLILSDGCELTVNGTDYNAAVRVPSGSSLSIYGQILGTGKLTADSAGRGAGIGGNGGPNNINATDGESSGTIILNGGIVLANRIGGGGGSDYIIGGPGFDGGHGGTVAINGGTLTVSGRIGGGNGGDGSSGATLEPDKGGDGGNGSNLTVRGGNVSVGGKIGGGDAGAGFFKPILGSRIYGKAGEAGSCTITGGSVNASSIEPVPKNDGGSAVSLTTVTLSGISTSQAIKALVVTSLSSPYGTRDMKTDTSGKLYLWIPASSSVTDAFSQGSRYTGSIPAGGSGTLAIAGTSPYVPVIVSMTPADGAAEVPVNGSISVIFDGMMYAWSGIITLRADHSDTIVLPRGVWNDSFMSYTAAYSDLSYNTMYTVDISGFTDVYDHEADSASFVFTTAAPPKSVMVGVQNSPLYYSTAGSADFPVTVTSIADGTYSVALDGAPVGVTAEDIIIASGSGTLIINTSDDTPEGTYTITAVIDGIISNSIILTVGPALPIVESVTVSPAAVELERGAAQEFTATVAGKNDPAQTVTWEIIGSNSASTGIDANGLLTVSSDETATSLTVKATSTVDTSVSGTATVSVKIRQISLGFVFPAATEGYEEQMPLEVPVINTGNQPTGELTVALSGRNKDDFILSKSTIDSLAANGSDNFSVKPKNGLTAGLYTATVNVTGENGLNKSLDVCFAVNSVSASPAITYTVSFDLNGGIRTGGGELTQTVAEGEAAIAPAVSRSGYTFAGWDKSFNNVTSNMTVIANWHYNEGSGSKSSEPGGDTADDTADDTTDAAIRQDRDPGQSAAVSINAVPTVGSDGHAVVTLSQDSFTDAIAEAQANAKKQGETSKDIIVSVNIDLPDTAESLEIGLSKSVLDTLADADITQLEINGSIISLGFDLEAIKQIQKQCMGDVTITVRPVQDLSEAARKHIGNRPVYDVTVSYISDGKMVSITMLANGGVMLSIPYEPDKNEAIGWLYGVYVDEDGNAARVPGSVYDANSGCIIMNSGHLSIYGVGYTAPSEKYADIADHWARESIDYVVGRGLFSGTTDTEFSPDTAMTRGMMVTVLGRLAEADVSGYKTSSFSDVAAGKYYQPYVEWAYKNGIVNGCGNDKFIPERAATREEIALILCNYARVTGYTLPVIYEAAAFTDNDSIGSPYKDAARALQQAGIMMGDSGNRFNPKSDITRAEVAAILHRCIQLTIDPATAQGWAKNDDDRYMYCKDGKHLTGWPEIPGSMGFEVNENGVRKAE